MARRRPERDSLVVVIGWRTLPAVALLPQEEWLAGPIDDKRVPPLPAPAGPDRRAGGSPVVRTAIGGGIVVVTVLLLTVVPADSATQIPVVTATVVSRTSDAATRDSISRERVAAAPPVPEPAPPPPPAPPPVAPSKPAASPPAPTTGIIATAGLRRGVTWTIDGQVSAHRPAVVTPGRHILTLSAPGYLTAVDTVRIRRGDTVHWNPRLAPQPVVHRVAASPAPPPPPPPPHTRSKPATSPTDAACTQAFDAQQWDAAFTACSQSAQGGSVTAQRDLGELYRRGHGVHHDDAAAVGWYQRAAQANDGEAMYQLGDAYEHGHGVQKDERTALDWYTRASNHGSPDAAYALGEAYEKGHLGLAKDRARALTWYKLAATQHFRDADDKVRQLSP